MNQMEQNVLQYLDDHKQDLFDLMSRLLQIDSQNYVNHGDEENCAPLLLEEFEKLGLEAEKYYPDAVPGVLENPDYLPGRGTDKRPNVCGIYRAEGSTKKIMITSHTDTMPIGNRDAWTVDPLGGEQKDGKIYGRGACDDKFGLATSILALQAIRASGVELENDVVIDAVCDEEYGGGNGALAACVKHKADAIINTDGGSYEVWTASMGGQSIELRPHCLNPQDSSTDMVEAFGIINEAVRAFADRRRAELHANRYYKDTVFERSALRVTEVSVGGGGCDLGKGVYHFVYYTTKSYEDITAELEQMRQEIGEKLKKLEIEIGEYHPCSRFFYYLTIEDDDPFTQLVKSGAEDACGKPVAINGASMSDLSLFLKHGSPQSLNFGILRDFKLKGGAHQADEFVDQQELLNHAKALALCMMRWCGAHEK